MSSGTSARVDAAAVAADRAPGTRPEARTDQPSADELTSLHALDGLLGRSDRGSRGRMVAHLQGRAGNRALQRLVDRPVRALQRQAGAEIPPNPYVVETPGGGATSELPANPYVGEDEPVTLGNRRFAGLAALERIAGGRGALSAADNGPAVQAVQQALLDLGYSLLQHERDGRFGDETRQAIGLFRSDRGLTGDRMNARAIGLLDTSAPPPGVAREHFLDYERLFADGYLDVTFAVGFDEAGSHTDQLRELRSGLGTRGFTPDAAATSGSEPDRYSVRRDVTYPLANGNRATREVIVRVSIIAPGAGAAARYGTALADSEVTLYSGHARRGIGPDFDENTSAAENFVIGINSALHAAGRAIAPSAVEQHHYVVDRVNDLEEMTRAGRFDPERYRVWMFNACTTLAYLDELRGGILPGGMDRRNLDVFGTQAPVPLMAEMTANLAMLDGILAAQTMEGIVRSMGAAGEAAVRAIPESEISATERAELLAPYGGRGMYFREGAGDNPAQR